MGLLPQHHRFITPSKEYVEVTTEILNLLISEAGDDINRLCRLVTSTKSLYRNQQEILLDYLESFDPQKAALCLARLTTLDPGGHLGNRPAASLKDIFLRTRASLSSYINTLGVTSS